MLAAFGTIVDERGSPQEAIASAPARPILQPTDERRRTGSHYTPRTLTEPIVRHALEPAFERLGPDATPEQMLDLKVCDPAMGSGAFLVEACRAARRPAGRGLGRATRTRSRRSRRTRTRSCTPAGWSRSAASTASTRTRSPPISRKLSLWLATLARDHEFTFLDHALKSGDSLVGLTQAQIAAAHWDTSKPGLPLFRQLVRERVAEAMKGRAEIQAAPDDTCARDPGGAARRVEDAAAADPRSMGDAVIAAFFAADKPKARREEAAEVESWLTAPRSCRLGQARRRPRRRCAHGRLTPFHWEIEFPEVFARDNGGFDAIVGNPPFAAARTISTEPGDAY